jgi:hypothetical protein
MHRDIVIKLLGLVPTATDEEISNAANTFQADMISFKEDMEAKVANSTTAVTAAEKRATDAETIANAATAENKTLTEELVNSDMATYKDRITNADDIKTALLSNRAGTIAILKNIKPATATVQRNEPLHNKATAGQPAPITAAAPVIANETATKISNRAREMSKSLGLSFQSAWIQAAREVAKESAAA